MDIIQMTYFINNVECGCNLSIAAKKIHISQSALSQFVTNFEVTEGLQLFNRRNGRLESLTEAGGKIYRFATEIVNRHEEMQSMIHMEAQKQKGTINLGIPSLILRVYFASALPKFLKDNPHINIQVVEGGSKDLRQKFLEGDLNFVLLIEPTNLDAKKYEQYIIQADEYAAYMDKNHPLADKELLEWKDIAAYDLATFNKSFTTYELVAEKLKNKKIETNFTYLSSAWDFLTESTYKNDMIAILPRPVEYFVDKNKFKAVRFKDPVPFNIWFCRPYKANYNEVEAYVYEELLKGYYQPISSLDT